jgi:hypothetical protein
VKKFNLSNIVVCIFVLFYCWTLQYNIFPDKNFSDKSDYYGEMYFVELQNTTNVPVLDYKLKLNNLVPVINRTLNVIFDGTIALKYSLSNILESKIYNFLIDKDKNYVFKDFRICFPFHYFY